MIYRVFLCLYTNILIERKQLIIDLNKYAYSNVNLNIIQINQFVRRLRPQAHNSITFTKAYDISITFIMRHILITPILQ